MSIKGIGILKGRNGLVKDLNRYLNEFTFRLKEGKYQTDTTDRMAAFLGSMPEGTITYAGFTGKA